MTYRLWSKLRSPCCRMTLDSTDDSDLICSGCGQTYPIAEAGPDLRPPGTDSDAAFESWRAVQEALAEWRARTWNDSADADARRRDTQRLAADFLGRSAPFGEVLDVGCGTGWIGELITARGCQYAGIDPQPCQTHYDFPFARSISDRLPFDDETFDTCLFFSSLDYSIDPGETLREVDRVLRPGGLIAIATPIHRTKDVEGVRLHNHRFVAGELETALGDRFGGRVDTWWDRETYQCLWTRKAA